MPKQNQFKNASPKSSPDNIYHQDRRPPSNTYHPEPSISPNLDAIDSRDDHIRELKQIGVWDSIVEHILETIGQHKTSSDEENLEIVRAVVAEIQGGNLWLNSDAFSYATELHVFGCSTLRQYAIRHGITPEGFSKHADGIIRRFGLPAKKVKTT